MQRADGLYGGLVIHRPVAEHEKRGSDLSTYQYEAEQLLLIGDWYHRPASAVLEWFMDANHYAYEVCLHTAVASPSRALGSGLTGIYSSRPPIRCSSTVEAPTTALWPSRRAPSIAALSRGRP